MIKWVMQIDFLRMQRRKLESVKVGAETAVLIA